MIFDNYFCMHHLYCLYWNSGSDMILPIGNGRFRKCLFTGLLTYYWNATRDEFLNIE